MKEMSAAGQQAIQELARRHGFSVEATRHMLDRVTRGNGRMAQFDHPEFSGSGQWMRGGMAMVSDMFDDGLKDSVDALCVDLATLVAGGPALFREHLPTARPGLASGSPDARATMTRSGDWWPGGMGHPNSAGSQNGMRYAYFARARRLAIERDGAVTLYDTQDHQIGGVSQQQSLSGSLRFTSQHGVVELASLPMVAGGGATPQPSLWP